MMLKMKEKILYSINSDVNIPLIFSYIGSSVTAGSQIIANESFPFMISELISPAIQVFPIDVITRNAAIDNSSCFPYDICVKVFAGLDADIIHWEKTHHCKFTKELPLLEQFLRQSVLLPNRPVIAVSDSDTDKWRRMDCPSPAQKHVLTPREKLLLEANPYRIATDLNRKETFKWGQLRDLIKRYPAAGIQTFTHTGHSAYRCQGPYVADWSGDEDSLLPGANGHQLRAAHTAYMWLSIWRDAVLALQSAAKTVGMDSLKEGVASDMEVAQHFKEPTGRLPPALFESNITDSITCLTNFEPRDSLASSITDKIVSGIAEAIGNQTGWQAEAEDGQKGHTSSWRTGYKGRKIAVTGTHSTGPLLLSIVAKKKGPLFLCGSSIRTARPDVSVYSPSSSKVIQLPYFPTQWASDCVQTFAFISSGAYMLSILPPKSGQRVSLSYILVP